MNTFMSVTYNKYETTAISWQLSLAQKLNTGKQLACLCPKVK